MKKSLFILLVLVSMIFLVGCGGDDPKPEPTDKDLDLALATTFKSLAKDKKVYLTTTGQADIDIVQNIIQNATGLKAIEDEVGDYVREDRLTAANVENNSVVFLVVGSSAKGLGGSSEAKVNEEKARAIAFGEKAVAGDIKLIILHVGGEGRRGSLSDPIISAVVPSANLLLVVVTGDNDNFFTNLSKNNNVPLYLFSKSTKLVPAFETLFQ